MQSKLYDKIYNETYTYQRLYYYDHYKWEWSVF